MINKEIQKVDSVIERDIDFLLLEELNVNPRFCDWFVRKVEMPEIEFYEGAWRSISDFGLGQTDILISYQTINGLVYILIENKLDAPFQDEQHSRYLSRIEKYKHEGVCVFAVAVLVAPEDYCSAQKDFDHHVTYEELADWLHGQEDERSKFKAELFHVAIRKLRRGYTPINSDKVQDFWLNYWRLKNEKLPDFKMKEPEVIPYNSDWPVLSIEELPRVKFYHKWKQGHVDANISGLMEDEVRRLEECSSEPFEFVRHNSSYSIRLKSSIVDRLAPFEDQQAEIIEGFDRISDLRRYLQEVVF